jgi:threonine aldolase
MYDAMRAAELGDDVNRADPTVNLLEAEAAALFGKEAALLVPSGTMANLIAAMVHGGPGDEILLDANAHFYHYEVGGLCSVAGYVPHFVDADRGRMKPEALRASIRPRNVHFPRPRLLWLENTHNRGGGVILEPERQEALVAIAREHDMSVHIDGARILNGAVALGRPVAEIVQNVDTVSLCLSKGLSCPVGSLLIGPRDRIDRAREIRKRLGGGMRQAGVIAACGRVALKEMVERLAEDHRNARQLAELLATLPGLIIRPEEIDTNMILIDVTGWGVDAYQVKKTIEANGVLVSEMSAVHVRVVTHRHFDAKQIPAVVEAFEKACPKG